MIQRLFVPTGFVVAVISFLFGVSDVQSEAVDPPIAEPNVEPIDYNHDGAALQGFLATPTSSDGPFPAVVIIPYVGISIFCMNLIAIFCINTQLLCLSSRLIKRTTLYTHKTSQYHQ